MKGKLIDELSVFFPCYNEEKNITNTVSKAVKVLESIAQKWEIIIINDGSKDNTAAVALKIKKQYSPHIKIVTHNPNRGYGAAFKSGLYNSKYEWIAFTDSDGQFDFSEIKNFIKTQQKTKADLVIGYYLGRKVSPLVVFTSKIWELIVFILFGLHVTDIDCGFKLVRKKVVDTIPKLEAERGAFISSEFLIKSKKAGFKITEIGVHHYPRTEGQATGRQLKVIIKSFTDLFKLWYKINFTRA
ncbi:MAG: Glycosyltransferase [Candidatus Shapirobacteria bacterium GW2011_GWE1_38_10]|uniref:Glycosyltransferase n=1 Tax=Candidatus Shapirobacteria bacterium GW2011_GWE1_38_10 TaxID=1618488 RepID=A0A0G0I894_9BACT|nr:MAG: Glycosyltransferase [Candidatus Shapirobacteria bacterium GW2011_GWF2_37_20]KKQ50737.1 MAG: Glycosyltransferase [Candidatus Shapirobacteria bacterium GW2011_GWE1_38_10]KKQ64487.1 MAG: Glycosyltransferase [Candidatus Shapirobacteria bacterium GW2011_GWF1_38_23]HBP51263.1 glycosyltransferase family 2 protein [Candidatus Shapirobacteria bacterium]